MQFPIVENFYGLDMLLLAMDTTRDQAGRAPKLLLGEGTPQTLRAHLRFGSSDRDIELLGDLSDLLKEENSQALLDGDRIPREDLGIILRALHQHSVTMTVLGGDPSAGPVRELLRMGGCSWIPYPPDTEELEQLMGEPSAPNRPEPPRQEPTLQKPFNEHNDPALAEIEAILSQPTGDLSFPLEGGASEASDDTEDQLFSEDTDSPQAFMQSSAERPSPATEAPWFKDQVADLADLVQIIYASSAATQDDNGGGAAAALLPAPPDGLGPPPMRLLTAASTFQPWASRNERAKPSSSVPATDLNIASFSAWSVMVSSQANAADRRGPAEAEHSPCRCPAPRLRASR